MDDPLGRCLTWFGKGSYSKKMIRKSTMSRWLTRDKGFLQPYAASFFV